MAARVRNEVLKSCINGIRSAKQELERNRDIAGRRLSKKRINEIRGFIDMNLHRIYIEA